MLASFDPSNVGTRSTSPLALVLSLKMHLHSKNLPRALTMACLISALLLCRRSSFCKLRATLCSDSLVSSRIFSTALWNFRYFFDSVYGLGMTNGAVGKQRSIGHWQLVVGGGAGGGVIFRSKTCTGTCSFFSAIVRLCLHRSSSAAYLFLAYRYGYGYGYANNNPKTKQTAMAWSSHSQPQNRTNGELAKCMIVT